MWLLKVVLFVALLALLVLVALGNDARVDVRLLGWELLQVRLFLVMFAAALFGFLAGLAFTAIREVQWRMAFRRQVRERSSLEEEVRHLRAAPVHGIDAEKRQESSSGDLPELY